MRLLQIGDDGSLTFTPDLSDDRIPRYAILSHTWGKPTDEVTYQDILDGTAISKDGFQKIKFCAEQAKRDGLEHIWVDTCCINKANSTELSEAINSMFRWYQKAAVCHVYLPDVSPNHRGGDLSSEEHLERQLKSSRWFTRGWTLQELIAPNDVVFYSKDWTRLGDRSSLLQIICEITRIPASALRGAALDDFSTTERLSWQENRQTTKGEDKAYALFGICGVNLPLIYGEGQEKAFRRLRSEIDNVSKGIRRQDFEVTYAVNDVIGVQNFVARQSELQQMRRVLGSEGSRQTVVIHGLGGMGKTQLMIEFAKRHRNDYSAIFWLNANDDGSLKASFANITQQILRDHPTAKGLVDLEQEQPDSFEDRITDGFETSIGLPGKKAKADRTVDTVKAWLSLPGNTRWLMLFDNLDNPKIPGNSDSAAVDIRKYLPSAQQGFVAITTRSSRLDVGHHMELAKLQGSEDSLKILCDSSKRDISPDDSAALRLLQRLDGLPLALATAGAYLRQSSMDLAEYLQWHDKAWAKLQQASPGLVTYEDRMLYSTWQVSFDQVNRINHLSANLLRLWAYFDNQDLWYELLCHDEQEMRDSYDADETYQRPKWVVDITKDKLTFEDAVRVLRDHGLVQPHRSQLELIESAGYSIHSCVHSWMRTVLNPVGVTDLAIFALKSVASHVPNGDGHKYWLTQRRLLHHASYTADGPLDEYPVGLAWALGHIGRLCGNYEKQSESMLLLEKAWHELETTAAIDLRARLDVARSLAHVYQRQGAFSKANDMAQLALHGFETMLGSQHPAALDTMHLVATLYRDRGKFAEAKDLHLRVLQAKAETLGLDNPSTLSTVIDCGHAHQALDELGEAERFLERALRGLHNNYGPNHPTTAKAKLFQALLAARREEYGKAEDMFQHAIVALESLYGPEDLKVLFACNWLGRVYTNQGRWRESEEMLLRSLKGYEDCCGVNGHRTLTGPVHDLGGLYQAQSRFADAEKMYLRMVQGLEHAFGLDHRATASAMHCLGDFYLERERLQEAEETLLRALQAHKIVYGASHSGTLHYTVERLGDTYFEQGKMEEAERMYLRAAQGLECALGPNDKKTAGTIYNLGNFYLGQERLQEAEETLLRALQAFEIAYGASQCETLHYPVQRLGDVYFKQGKMEEAGRMYLRAAQGLECALGPNDEKTAGTIYNLGNFYLGQEKLQEAEQTLLRALQAFEIVFGVSQYKTLYYPVQRLGDMYFKQGRTEEGEKMYLRALQGLNCAVGLDHQYTAQISNNLGYEYWTQNRLQDAEQLLLQALQGCEGACEPEYIDGLEYPVVNLCRLYLDQGRVKKAQEMYQRALPRKDRMSAMGQEQLELIRKKIERLQRQNAEVNKCETQVAIRPQKPQSKFKAFFKWSN